MAQEAIMKWSQIEASWKQLKDKFAFWPFRLSDDDSESYHLIGPEISRVSQSDEFRRRPSTPTTGEGEVSFHCISAADGIHPDCGDASFGPCV